MTNPEHPFACGVMLKELTATTTNAQWKPTTLDADASSIYKVTRAVCEPNAYLHLKGKGKGRVYSQAPIIVLLTSQLPPWCF